MNNTHMGALDFVVGEKMNDKIASRAGIMNVLAASSSMFLLFRPLFCEQEKGHQSQPEGSASHNPKVSASDNHKMATSYNQIWVTNPKQEMAFGRNYEMGTSHSQRRCFSHNLGRGISHNQERAPTGKGQ